MAERRLSTRDKKLRQSLLLSPDELLADLVTDHRASNVDELIRTIDRTKNKATKQILNGELLGIQMRTEQFDQSPGITVPKQTEQTTEQKAQSTIESLLHSIKNIFASNE
jgi:Mg/Co/Ni transporter MgtE